jgi:CRP-like cAMP-binding protein
MVRLSREEKIEFFQTSAFLKGVKPGALADLADATREVYYPKGSILTRESRYADEVFIVSCGLLRVSAVSESGKRVTFLLARKGEPYNILSPFMKQPRHFMAEAVKDTRCLQLGGGHFLRLIESHPEILYSIITWVAPALDSAFSRILDQMEKKVEFRIMRVLRTLSSKFGSTLFFTNAELAELAGTTTASAIRAVAVLRDLGAIETRRGKIWVKDTEALSREEVEHIRI